MYHRSCVSATCQRYLSCHFSQLRENLQCSKCEITVRKWTGKWKVLAEGEERWSKLSLSPFVPRTAREVLTKSKAENSRINEGDSRQQSSTHARI